MATRCWEPNPFGDFLFRFYEKVRRGLGVIRGESIILKKSPQKSPKVPKRIRTHTKKVPKRIRPHTLLHYIRSTYCYKLCACRI